METISPEQSKLGRKALGLSQRKTSDLSGFQRHKLSMFEAGNMVLKDAEARKLRRFYESKGVDMDSLGENLPAANDDAPVGDQEKPVRAGTKPEGKQLMPMVEPERILPKGTMHFDGLVIPAVTPEPLAEGIGEEMDANEAEIARILSEPSETEGGFLSAEVLGEDCRDACDQAVRLMARNWQLLQLLQGRDVVEFGEGEYAPNQEKPDDLVRSGYVASQLDKAVRERQKREKLANKRLAR